MRTHAPRIYICLYDLLCEWAKKRLDYLTRCLNGKSPVWTSEKPDLFCFLHHFGENRNQKHSRELKRWPVTGDRDKHNVISIVLGRTVPKYMRARVRLKKFNKKNSWKNRQSMDFRAQITIIMKNWMKGRCFYFHFRLLCSYMNILAFSAYFNFFLVLLFCIST